MFNNILKQFLKAAALTVAGCNILLIASPAQAATCSINPQNPMINAGGSIAFSVSFQGKFRGSKTYDWQFSGGSPASSTNASETVTYASAGSFPVILDATSSKDGEASCATTVTVNNVGNQAPVANDDSYSTDQDVVLSVTAPGVLGNDTDADNDPITVDTFDPVSSQGGSVSMQTDGSFDYTPPAAFTGTDTFTYTATDGVDISNLATVTITVNAVGGGGPTARGDTYATPIGKTLDVAASRVSGVLYNDFGGTGSLSAINLDTRGTLGGVTLNADGSFTYVPPSGAVDNQVDTFRYQAQDSAGQLSTVTTVAVQILSDQPDYKMTMNYELGMHCTGFEFAYCCVLPPYNSIVAQITKPGSGEGSNQAELFPRLLDATPDPATRDGLGRETVLRDLELDGNSNFRRYQVKYFHDAQPRAEGNGKPQTSTLISDAEGATLLYHRTKVDSAQIGPNGELIYGSYADGGAGAVAYGVWQGDGDTTDPTDNYANAWLNHFYIYADLEGTIPPGSNSQEANKLRLGVTGQVEYPANVGAALQPLGPISEGIPSIDATGFDNVLTFSTDTGTVVYTQMKVLEDLPIMLTSPRIWEGLGLPLTPFEDDIGFYLDPGEVAEENIRPYVAMKGQLVEYPSGNAVIGTNGEPVIGFGTAPIDIPNCERCHSTPAQNSQGQDNVNSPIFVKNATFDTSVTPTGLDLAALTDLEYQYWMAFYGLMPSQGDSDWYPRLKSAAINMMALHDSENGTGFTANYPGCGPDPADCGSFNDPTFAAQNNRLGFESVVCQKCHADNVIAAVKSGCEVDPGSSSIAPLCPDVGSTEGRKIIQPITEAVHWNHRGIDEGGVIAFSDSLGRDGGCQGCHPAHRSDGVTDGYPITLDGNNALANSDNRLALGGCFVGRDVHSNPLKDVDGAETPVYLNAVGQWLSNNVYNNQAGLAGSDADDRGIWCTNCHNQLGQSIWAAENMVDLINGIPGKEADLVTDAVNIRALPSLAAIEQELGLPAGQAAIWLDPQDGPNDATHSIWNPNVVANPDANVATIEVSTSAEGCGPRFAFPGTVPRFGVYACLDFDGDPGGITGFGDPSVRILDFCTTPDCVTLAQQTLDAEGNGSIAAPVPFDAATDGRDHWLAPGEPHCADCHAAPFVEQSGNINPFPPFNYPRKASLMRYSRGHMDLTCQSCHESSHGLYPVSPTLDTTSYAQAAALNPDGSHGPLKCAACHEVNGAGVPTILEDGTLYNGQPIVEDYDAAVAWMHTFTDNADLREGYCLNCHTDFRDEISASNRTWTEHAYKDRSSRKLMDLAEVLQLGNVAGSGTVGGGGADDPLTTVCTSCHGDRSRTLERRGCTTKWKNHLIEGRAAGSVWSNISEALTGSNCGW